jgi:hypothetical protein
MAFHIILQRIIPALKDAGAAPSALASLYRWFAAMFLCVEKLILFFASGITSIASALTSGVGHRWSTRNDDESFYQWCCSCGIAIASQ